MGKITSKGESKKNKKICKNGNIENRLNLVKRAISTVNCTIKLGKRSKRQKRQVAMCKNEKSLSQTPRKPH